MLFIKTLIQLINHPLTKVRSMEDPIPPQWDYMFTYIYIYLYIYIYVLSLYIYIYVKYTVYPLSNPKNPSNSQANEGIGSPHLITRSATLRWPNSARSSATAGSRDRAAPGELAAEKIVGKS